MRVLLTGVAGFIGYHVAEALLKRGDEVVGIDNLNDYYEVSLKEARLEKLKPHRNFSFQKADVADRDAMLALASRDFTHVAHLAAQAGVRYSLENPCAYVHSNVMGQTVMLEAARRMKGLKHFIYASSSSVYGGNKKIPFAVGDTVDRPLSPYAATKRAAELAAWTHARLYKMPCTGLRFFTVYGPWGRPDMAAYSFAKLISAGQPIKLFNHGKQKRDFTYIDDIAEGVLASLDHIPAEKDGSPHALYNLGNSKAENLTDFVAALEAALGKRAITELVPAQPGDMLETYADIEASTRDLGFRPKTSITEGLGKFAAWYRSYHKA